MCILSCIFSYSNYPLWFWSYYLTALSTVVSISRGSTKRTNQFKCPIPYSWMRTTCLLPLLERNNLRAGTDLEQRVLSFKELLYHSFLLGLQEAHQHGGKPRGRPSFPVWTKTQQLWAHYSAKSQLYSWAVPILTALPEDLLGLHCRWVTGLGESHVFNHSDSGWLG